MTKVVVKLRATARFRSASVGERALEPLFDRITEMLLDQNDCEDPAVGGSLACGEFDVEFVTLGGEFESPTDDDLRSATDSALLRAKGIIDAIVQLGEAEGAEAQLPAVDWLGLEAQNVREPVPA